MVSSIGKQNVILFHDEIGDPYTKIKVQNHHEIRKVKSKQFKRWLSKQFWDSEKKVPNSESLNSAIEITNWIK